MTISRRELLGTLASGMALQAFGGLSLTAACAPSHETPLDGPIYLSGNENAYGPSKKVLAAMQESMASANRYPEKTCELLRDKLAAFHKVSPEQVILGCGSSEVLGMAVEEFLGPGKTLIQASPTCSLPGRSAKNTGASVINVPLNRNCEHDLDVMLARVDVTTALVYICNPNNPTGTLTPRKDIEGFIRKLPATTMVLIDEAYHPFVGASSSNPSFLDYPLNDGRVMVTRTFSKIHGLAGMRVGYLLASPENSLRLSRRRMGPGISAISARAAMAALDDHEFLAIAMKRNTDDRQEFMNQVGARMLRAIDSHTNFVMLNSVRPADEVFQHMKNHGVLVAPPVPEMSRFIRVSLGTPVEMAQFWRVWDLMPNMPHQKMSM